MRPIDDDAPAPGAAPPRWALVLRALREARGATQAGWGARLGVSRRTVQRWEEGERAPDPGAEAALLAYCREAGLFRAHDRGPLAGLDLTAERLHDLFAEARSRPVRGTGPGGGPAGAAPPSDRPGAAQTNGTPLATSGPARPPPSNLPAPLTSFVGREDELAAVRRALGGRRLLTLTGAGGCGKTRLALRVADELLWAYPHGVWLVELAALADSALVPSTVAAALGLRTTEPPPAAEALKDHLRTRRLLLILDNCEHLLAACAALVGTLLGTCPHLEVLATSREPLGLGGEAVWPVPPLAVPGAGFRVPGDGAGVQPGTLPSAADVPDSVRLFVERARLRRPGFALTVLNAEAVAEVCRRLDGIPLAIELAASRMRALSVEQIADRLDDRLRLLTGGSRTALPRQQTLRATLDWSHDLLTAEEQALLRRLSVFAGGFTLEAAEAVVGDDRDKGRRTNGESDERGGGEGIRPSSPRSARGRLLVIRPPDVLDLLARLVDQSLVVGDDEGGATRFRVLETVRQYAAEQLAAAGEASAARDRHLRWCLTLAAAAGAHRTGPEQKAWLERLTVEHDNLRAALAWCLSDTGGGTAGLRLASALAWFWEVRGHFGEARRWLVALLARGGGAPPAVRADALNCAGWLAERQGDYEEAARLFEQGLVLRRALEDEAGVARSLNSLGVVAVGRGDHARARTLYEESLAVHRKLGNRLDLARSLNNLAIVARQLGEPDRAVALYEESLALHREQGDAWRIAQALSNLGNAHRDQGALEPAVARYRESLSLYRELQDPLGTARCLEGLAGVAAARGEAARAARLCGAAAALRATIGVPPTPAGRAALDRTTAAARAALGETAFAGAWAAGEALSLEAAVAEALSDGAPA